MADQALRKEWGQKIKARRHELNDMTQFELAVATGIQPATISKIERGAMVRIDDDCRIAIARALEVEVADLFPYPRLDEVVAS